MAAAGPSHLTIEWRRVGIWRSLAGSLFSLLPLWPLCTDEVRVTGGKQRCGSDQVTLLRSSFWYVNAQVDESATDAGNHLDGRTGDDRRDELHQTILSQSV